MTSGPTYGQGFIDLEPRLDAGFLSRINSQLDRAFSNIRLDIDDAPVRNIARALETVETTANNAEGEMADMARRSGDVEANIRNLAGHLGISEGQARDLAQQIIRAQDNTALLERSALETARAMGLSEAEAKKFASAINRVDDAPLRRIDSSLSRIRSSLTTAATGAIAFFGVRGAVGLATAARDSFIELEESVNAVNVVFGEGAEAIFSFGDTVAESAGLARSEFQQMSTVLGSALINAGFTADEAAAKTINLTQRAADMASVFNTDVQQALGAIQAALRGESDPIERFGVSLSAAAVDAKAAALGYKTVAGEFDATAKAAARLALIMEQTDRVSGDFANTSDSLANRSRINAAQFENLRAELGEKLLPVFEALVAAGPELLEGLGDLAPSLVGLAESAANLSKSTPGVLDFIDALRLLVDLPRGIGQLGDLVTAQITVMTGAGSALGRLFTGDIPGAIRQVETSLNDLGKTAQRTIERINTQGLVNDLREGEDAASALANRLVEVGKKGKLDRDFVKDLAAIAGTDLTETANVLESILDRASEFGLAADEVAALELQFNILRNTIFPVGNEVAQAARQMDEFADSTDRAGVEASLTARGAMAELERMADDAGVSLAELALKGEPAADALIAVLDPADRLAIKLEGVATGVITAADAFEDRLAPSLIDVSDALIDFNKNGQVSLDEFIRGLDETFTATANFRENMLEILRISPEAFAELLELPFDQAAALVQEAVSTDREEELADALVGDPDELAEEISNIVFEAINIFRTEGPDAAEDFVLGIPRLFDDEELGRQIVADAEAAIEASRNDIGNLIENAFRQDDAVNRAAGFTADAYDRALLRRLGATAFARGEDIGDIIAESFRVDDIVTNDLINDLIRQGQEARGAFMLGLNTIRAGEVSRLRSSIISTVDAAVQRSSPPKLFVDAGEDARDAFWSPFGVMPIDFAMPNLSRLSTGTFDAIDNDGAGGNQFNVTVNNPIGEPTEDSLQAALIEVAVSPTVNRLVSAGSSR